MKTILPATVLLSFFLFLFPGIGHAQPAGGAPVNRLPASRQEGPSGPATIIVPAGYVWYKGCLVPKAALEAYQGGAGRPAAVPPGYVVYKGVLVPTTILEAQQREGGRAQAGPRSEEEKRRVLHEQLQKYKAMAQTRRNAPQ